MKRWLWLALLTLPLGAQEGRTRLQMGPSDPVNPCDPLRFYINYTTGNRWYCATGTWAATTQPISAADISSGTVATERLGSGTANSSTFLRGDQTWGAPTASAAWGSITGTLGSQTDLQSALDGKQALGTYSGTGACGANTWASTLGTGAPTCTQPAFSNISGTVSDAQLANNYSGVGACGANTWASTLSDNAAPTCTQPGFSNLSGSASDAQIPNTITLDNLTQITTRAISDTTGTLAVTRGGTGAAPAGDDQVLVSDSSSAATWRTLTDCQGAGKALTYTAASNTWGCNTISGGGGATYVLLTADRINATTSYANITDLSWSVAASTRYDIECKLIYSANATTTGIGIGWTGPASPTLTGGAMRAGLTSATVGGTTVVGNDTGGVTTASVATSGNMATFEGFWSNGANAGTLQMRFKSEVAVADAITIKAGSWCRYSVY